MKKQKTAKQAYRTKRRERQKVREMKQNPLGGYPTIEDQLRADYKLGMVPE